MITNLEKKIKQIDSRLVHLPNALYWQFAFAEALAQNKDPLPQIPLWAVSCLTEGENRSPEASRITELTNRADIQRMLGPVAKKNEAHLRSFTTRYPHQAQPTIWPLARDIDKLESLRIEREKIMEHVFVERLHTAELGSTQEIVRAFCLVKPLDEYNWVLTTATNHISSHNQRIPNKRIGGSNVFTALWEQKAPLSLFGFSPSVENYG